MATKIKSEEPTPYTVKRRATPSLSNFATDDLIAELRRRLPAECGWL